MRGKFRTDRRTGYLFIVPALLVILAFIVIPQVYGVIISLYDYNVGSPGLSAFVGVRNYVSVLTSSSFWKSLKVVMVFTVSSILFQSILGLGIALVLNQKFCGRGLLRALIVLPQGIPIVVNAILWRWIFDPVYGALNGVLFHAGIIDTYKVWLGDPKLALFMVLIADSWQMIPLYVIFFLAGLQTIPGILYEAASIDGAGPWRRFTHVTLPLLKPIFLIVLIIRTADLAKVFDIFYVMTGGGPGDTTDVTSLYLYRTAFNNLDFGRANAIGSLMGCMLIILSFIYIKLMYSEMEV